MFRLLVFLCLWASGVQPELERPSAKQLRERDLLPGLQGVRGHFLQRFRELWFAWQGFLGLHHNFRVIYDSCSFEKLSTSVSTYSRVLPCSDPTEHLICVVRGWVLRHLGWGNRGTSGGEGSWAGRDPGGF